MLRVEESREGLVKKLMVEKGRAGRCCFFEFLLLFPHLCFPSFLKPPGEGRLIVELPSAEILIPKHLVLHLKRQVVLEWVLVSSLSSVLVYPIAEKKVRCVSKSLICQPCLLPLAGDLSPLSFLDPTIHWFLLLQ